MKPMAQNLFQVSHVGAGSQVIGPSSTAFPGHKKGAGWEAGLPGLEPVTLWDPDMSKVKTLVTRLLHRAQVILIYDLLIILFKLV